MSAAEAPASPCAIVASGKTRAVAGETGRRGEAFVSCEVSCSPVLHAGTPRWGPARRRRRRPSLVTSMLYVALGRTRPNALVADFDQDRQMSNGAHVPAGAKSQLLRIAAVATLRCRYETAPVNSWVSPPPCGSGSSGAVKSPLRQSFWALIAASRPVTGRRVEIPAIASTTALVRRSVT